MEKNKIFISHRHSDTQSDCHRLKSDLQKIFGKDQVFLDIENLEPGIKFADAIEKTLAQSKVVLVVIGPGWLHVTNDKGGKRLFDEKDWVRREIAASLNDSNTRVIPVLVKDASIPEEEDLPDDLKPLTQLQVAEITTKRWDYDLGELIKVLEKLVPKRQDRPAQNTAQRQFIPSPPKPKSWWAKNYLWALGGIVGFLVLLGMCVPTGEDYTYPPDDDNNIIVDDPGTSKYNDLTLGDKIPTLSGNWILYLNGEKASTLVFAQNGSEVEFKEYNAFNDHIGEGSGQIESQELVLDYFNSVIELAGTISVSTVNSGQTWEGGIYFPSTGGSGQIELRKK